VYETVARMRRKPGGVAWIRAWVDAQSTRRTVAGWISTIIYQSDENPNVVRMTVVFESRESCHATAATPVQDYLYHQMLTGLEAPPEWHDKESISMMHKSDVRGA